MGRAYKQVEARILRNHRTEALAEQGGCCRYCFAPLTVKTSTADHRRPRANGGTNARRNIVACCLDCNMTKGSMPVLAFTRAIKNPPAGASFYMWMAWSRRRVWLATHRASRNIRYAVGLENNTPIGKVAA
jgi:5-methylcytosine-specific restriction endonuclease McrA